MGQRIPKGASRSVGLKSPLTLFGKLLATPGATPLTQVDFSYGLPTGAFVSTISGRALSTTTSVITGTSWIEER